MIKDQPLQLFLDELASKAPTPGGGSGAAVMGAMAAALVSMVGNLTVGKKGYEEVASDLENTLQQSEKLRHHITNLIQADVEAFNSLMQAYALPRETTDEQAARGVAIQTALKTATEVPLSCARACAEVIALCQTAAEKGNLNVISDAGVAVVAAEAALKSAVLNVEINIGSIKDQTFTEDKSAELKKILQMTQDQADKIYTLVKSKL